MRISNLLLGIGLVLSLVLIPVEVIAQNAATTADVIVAAPDPVAAVPLTEEQVVVVEYGNWFKLILDAISGVALTVVPVIAVWLMMLIPSWLRLFIPAKKVNDLVENAVRAALASASNATSGKTLTIPVTNDVIRGAIVYMLSNAPGLVKSLGDSLPVLIQKVIARLADQAPVPKGFTLESAVKAVTPESVVVAAAKAKVDLKEEVKAYIGGTETVVVGKN